MKWEPLCISRVRRLFLRETEGGGSGNAVDYSKGNFHEGDALVHSHGHYDGPNDMSQHVDLLRAGLSAVYTLARGYLYVQWNSGTTLSGPTRIYNVCAALGERVCDH